MMKNALFLSINLYSTWYCSTQLFSIHNREIIISPREAVSTLGLAFMVILAPTFLSTKSKSDEDVAIYNPQMVIGKIGLGSRGALDL